MSKFKVTTRKTVYSTYLVEAENETKALDAWHEGMDYAGGLEPDMEESEEPYIVRTEEVKS